MTSTSVATAQLPGATVQMQTTVPRLGQTHIYVMRGLLAKAAVHLACLRPAQRARYNMLAARHHSLALPVFRSALNEISGDNAMALILYAKGLVWCSFAGYSSSRTGSETTLHTADWMPDWFTLLRGSCLIANECKRWMGDEQYMLPPPLDDLTDWMESLDHSRLLDLKVSIEDLVDTTSCTPALSALENAFAQASMRYNNTPLRNAMNSWMSSISDDYLKAVRCEEQWALAILAHFGILVYRSETQWFMQGHAAAFLQEIENRMDQSSKELIRWPREEIWGSIRS